MPVTSPTGSTKTAARAIPKARPSLGTFFRLFHRQREFAREGQNELRRTEQQLREQYLVEVELGDRLRNATKAERRSLYTIVYDELHERIPHHPSLLRQEHPELIAGHVADRFAWLKHLLKPTDKYLEIGAGDCRLALEVAKVVQKVTVVEVSEATGLKRLPVRPANFEAILSDGVNFSVKTPGEFTVAYSGDVIEHLHPDDVMDQLKDARQALAPGGIYVCVTPHRYEGPSDISRFFDTEAKGTHLKEYTNGELARLFKNAGFSRVRCRILVRSRGFSCPVWPIQWIEKGLAILPHRARRALATRLPLRLLLRICIVATK